MLSPVPVSAEFRSSSTRKSLSQLLAELDHGGDRDLCIRKNIEKVLMHPDYPAYECAASTAIARRWYRLYEGFCTTPENTAQIALLLYDATKDALKGHKHENPLGPLEKLCDFFKKSPELKTGDDVHIFLTEVSRGFLTRDLNHRHLFTARFCPRMTKKEFPPTKHPSVEMGFACA